MKKRPRIALAQIKYFDLDQKHNLEKIISSIIKAKKGRADIICFPETAVLKEKYLYSGHKFLKVIRETCRENQIWCILTDDNLHNGTLYNTAMVIDRHGKIRGRYKKKHLYSERGVIPGKRIRVINTDFGRIGLAICWDLAFPELFKSMKKSGAKIIFCPTQWSYEKKAYEKGHKKKETRLLKSLILSRAFENLFFVALCSPFRPEDKTLISYSAIASPHEIIKEIFNKEGIIFADIKLSDITKFKRIYPRK